MNGAVHIAYVGNDMLVELDELMNMATNAYVNDATVLCTLVDSTGANVTGQSWPLSLSYVATSSGKYRGTLNAGLALSKSRRYKAKITVTAGSLTGYWEQDVIALARQ